jgi:hypothetical protein
MHEHHARAGMDSYLLGENSRHDHADPATYCVNDKYVEGIEKGIAYPVSCHANTTDNGSGNTKQGRDAA